MDDAILFEKTKCVELLRDALDAFGLGKESD